MPTRSLAAPMIPILVILAAGAGPAGAEPESFYQGKTIRIIVGLAAGGGFDSYARLLARHMAKHVPGNPTILVDNMPGAGSLISANHLYKIAQPDGLTLGHFNGSLILGQALGQPGIEFDARKFEFVGAASKEEVVCALTKASGVSSMEKWMESKTPVKIGGIATGAFAPDNAARVLKATLGLPIQVVTGYKGTAEIRLAAEGGELSGSCWGWESMRAAWRKALDAGEVLVVLQATPAAFPDLPKVPLAIDLAKTDEARRLIRAAIHSPSSYARPFVLPPGTPRDRVELLRRAFAETVKDPAFLSEAEKAKLGIELVPGESLQKMVAEFFTLDPALLAKMKDIFYNN